MKSNLKVGGVFTFEQLRGGKLIASWKKENLVVDEGLDYIIGAPFDGSVVTSATWYIGLFSGNYTPTSTDNASNISLNSTEITTAYSEATRPLWIQAGVSSQVIGNAASPAVFNFTDASTDVYGAMLISNGTKNATTGILAAASRFATTRTMLAGDVLNVSYSLTISSL